MLGGRPEFRGWLQPGDQSFSVLRVGSAQAHDATVEFAPAQPLDELWRLVEGDHIADQLVEVQLATPIPIGELGEEAAGVGRAEAAADECFVVIQLPWRKRYVDCNRG